VDGMNWWDWLFPSFITLFYSEWGTFQILYGLVLIILGMIGEVGESFHWMFNIKRSKFYKYYMLRYPIHTNRLVMQHGCDLVIYGLFAWWALFTVWD